MISMNGSITTHPHSQKERSQKHVAVIAFNSIRRVLSLSFSFVPLRAPGGGLMCRMTGVTLPHHNRLSARRWRKENSMKREAVRLPNLHLSKMSADTQRSSTVVCETAFRWNEQIIVDATPVLRSAFSAVSDPPTRHVRPFCGFGLLWQSRKPPPQASVDLLPPTSPAITLMCFPSHHRAVRFVACLSLPLCHHHSARAAESLEMQRQTTRHHQAAPNSLSVDLP